MDVITVDEISINTVTGTIYVDNRKIESTIKEYELLKFMMENKGITLKKEYLFNTIWGSNSEKVGGSKM